MVSALVLSICFLAVPRNSAKNGPRPDRLIVVHSSGNISAFEEVFVYKNKVKVVNLGSVKNGGNYLSCIAVFGRLIAIRWEPPYGTENSLEVVQVAGKHLLNRGKLLIGAPFNFGWSGPRTLNVVVESGKSPTLSGYSGVVVRAINSDRKRFFERSTKEVLTFRRLTNAVWTSKELVKSGIVRPLSEISNPFFEIGSVAPVSGPTEADGCKQNKEIIYATQDRRGNSVRLMMCSGKWRLSTIEHNCQPVSVSLLRNGFAVLEQAKSGRILKFFASRDLHEFAQILCEKYCINYSGA